MDGRVQLPVNSFLKERFEADYVDTVTEAGPNGILAARDNGTLVESIIDRVRISVEKHGSTRLAVTGHHDCAGNPVGENEQIEQIKKAARYLKDRFPEVDIIGLWVDEGFNVQEIVLPS
jgi:carbonic anhydrase